jgi:perosamine synthetase
MPTMNQSLTKTARPKLSDLLHWPRNRWRKTLFQPATYLLTLNGRNALYLSLGALGIKVGDTVLLPAFHCTALVEPFIAYGCRIQYYSVGRDLGLNFDELEELTQLPGVRAILLVHFFGLPGPSAKLRALSTRRNLKLIEDCTHTLFSIDKKSMAGDAPVPLVLGAQGDASVFSFRKILSVEDGGALVLPKLGIAGNPIRLQSPFIYHLRMFKWVLDHWKGRGNAVVTETPNSNSATRPAKNHNEVIPSSPTLGILASGPSKGPDSHEVPTFIRSYVNWAMAWPSKWILAGANPTRIGQIRRNNYLRLESLLQGLPCLVPFTQGLEEGLCPMGYPFLALNYPRLDYALSKRQIPAFSFGETLHAGLDLKAFPDAAFLSKHLVLLPVHQGLTEQDLQTMAHEVRACLTQK